MEKKIEKRSCNPKKEMQRSKTELLQFDASRVEDISGVATTLV